MRNVVLAIRDPEFATGRLFDPATVETFRESLKPMATPWLKAAELGREHGLRFLTADQMGVDGVTPDQSQLISYDFTPQAESLIAEGARPSILVSLEPPLIAWWLYLHLPRVSAQFAHTYMFEGARTRVASASQFHRLYFPQSYARPGRPPLPWNQRGYLAMVNSAKRIVTSLTRWFDRPREVSLKRFAASLRYSPIRSEGYRVRQRLIEFFSGVDGFDLYGEGWEQRHPAMSPRAHQRALRAYRGRAGDKLELLSQYRFALAIENTSFPGYLSEKLLDCLAAGTIPVYFGDPTVAEQVPPEAFVDMRQFRSYTDLNRFLLSVSPREAESYLQAGRAYVESEEFRQHHTPDAFARDVVAMLQV